MNSSSLKEPRLKGLLGWPTSTPRGGHLSVEVVEQSPLGVLDEGLDFVLEPEPFELDRDQLVAGHHRVSGLHPAFVQRASAGLGRLVQGRVLVDLVVGARHRVGGDVDEDDLALLQLLRRQLVQVFGRAPVRIVIALDADAKLLLHVSGIGEDGLAVGVGVPSLLVDLQRALGSDGLDDGRYFAGQMVDLVGVLALAELATKQGDVFEGFVLDDLDSFASPGLVLTGLGHAVELSYLVLLHRHGQSDAELLDQHDVGFRKSRTTKN